MLSGEGNAGELSKKQLCMCSTLFFTNISLPLFFHNYKVKLPETSYNVVTRFMEEMSYVFSFTLFNAAHFYLALVAASISRFLTAVTKVHFYLALVAASISRFLTAVTKVSCCFSNNPSFRTLSLFFSLGFAGLPLHSLFPCLSLALHSKFLDMTINLSLILYTCCFRLYLLFSCLCITRRGWLCDFPPK